MVLRSATPPARRSSAPRSDSTLLDLVEAIIGPDIELFGQGQCLYKEPVGGTRSTCTKDSSYFEHPL